MQNLPEFLRLIWETSPKYLLLNVFLRVVKASLPLVMLYLGKLIIDEVLLLLEGHPEGDLNDLWLLVGAELVLALLSDFASRLITLVDSLLGDLFANRTSVRLIEHAATLDLYYFEDSEFYDKLERARR